MRRSGGAVCADDRAGTDVCARGLAEAIEPRAADQVGIKTL
jgi:hypothetical protein